MSTFGHHTLGEMRKTFSDEINEALVKLKAFSQNVMLKTFLSMQIVQQVLLYCPTQMICMLNFQNLLSTNLVGGEVLLWQSFWDQYSTAFYTNSSLSDIEKFNFLRSYLTETPGVCIKGLSLTPANYQKSVEILKERNGNK